MERRLGSIDIHLGAVFAFFDQIFGCAVLFPDQRKQRNVGLLVQVVEIHLSFKQVDKQFGVFFGFPFSIPSSV